MPKVDCELCNGTGKNPFYIEPDPDSVIKTYLRPSRMCSRCGGTGKVTRIVLEQPEFIMPKYIETPTDLFGKKKTVQDELVDALERIGAIAKQPTNLNPTQALRTIRDIAEKALERARKK